MEFKKCSVDGCERKVWGLGFCQKHYMRVRNHGHPGLIRLNQRRICKIDGCGKLHAARGYCLYHYNHFKNLGEFTNQTCSFGDCKKPLYAKGLCHTHHAISVRNSGVVIYKKDKPLLKCKINGCDELSHSNTGLCPFHRYRLSAGIDLLAPKGVSGENNPNWNGGTSQYKNHYLMKKLRKEVLEEANHVCEKCHGYADEIHHRDFDKSHQEKSNYMPCCHKCNMSYHPNHTSKYRKTYGVILKVLNEAIRMNNQWDHNKTTNLTVIKRKRRFGHKKGFMQTSRYPMQLSYGSNGFAFI